LEISFVITSALQIAFQLVLSIQMHYISRMKTTTIQIRLTPSEKQAFENAAKLSGLALSAWVRSRLRKAATRELEDASRPIPFLTEIANAGD
jgi:uncharacterized protein (DUF1778 family)